MNKNVRALFIHFTINEQYKDNDKYKYKIQQEIKTTQYMEQHIIVQCCRSVTWRRTVPLALKTAKYYTEKRPQVIEIIRSIIYRSFV